jgi:hypothetical protein
MDLTPQLDRLLDELAKECCAAMQANTKLDHDRIEKLVAALSINGWKQHSRHERALADEIRDRVIRLCPEPAMHRGAELGRLAESVEKIYQEYSRYQATTPEDQKPPAKQTQQQPAPPKTGP